MRTALAAASGILLALSFPKYGHPACGWIALAPLLFALRGASGRRAFLYGWVTGATFFTGTLYWITHVMAAYGDMQTWVAVVINALLIAYLSIYLAVFALAAARLVGVYGRSAILAAPLVWVTLELARTHVLSGFPWVLLGYSQTTVLPIAQLASAGGVYGVSLLVSSVSAATVFAFDSRRLQIVPLAIVLAIVAGVAAWGSRRAADRAWTREGEAVRVGLVQGNVDQGTKWDAVSAPAIFEDYIRKTRDAIFKGASLVVWPESSTPFLFEEEPVGAERLRALARQARVTLLFGSDQIEWRNVDNRRVVDRMFNAAFLVRADGTTAGAYRKMHLVPFGEYVPWQRLLFFAAPLTEQVGTFAAGDRPELLPVDGHRLSVAICYEVVYPQLVRQFVVGGSELLTTITNDAWFGATSAPYQHFEQASMRAIEEGRYMVRAANTGISGIVDPYGRVLERSDIFQPAVLVGEARFLKASTFYARHGDVVAYVCVAITVALLFVPKRRVQ